MTFNQKIATFLLATSLLSFNLVFSVKAVEGTYLINSDNSSLSAGDRSDSDTYPITLTLKDNVGNSILHSNFSLTSELSSGSITGFSSNEDGTYSATLNPDNLSIDLKVSATYPNITCNSESVVLGDSGQGTLSDDEFELYEQAGFNLSSIKSYSDTQGFDQSVTESYLTEQIDFLEGITATSDDVAAFVTKVYEMSQQIACIAANELVEIASLTTTLTNPDDLDGDGIEDMLDLDDDGDGVSDEQELIDGTDPRNKDDYKKDLDTMPYMPAHPMPKRNPVMTTPRTGAPIL